MEEYHSDDPVHVAIWKDEGVPELRIRAGGNSYRNAYDGRTEGAMQKPMNASTDRELREFDRWIAKHVFGYTVRVNPRLSASDERTYYDPNTGWLAKWNGPNKRSWSPTTDRAAAMQVLEKCAERVGDAVRIRHLSDGRYGVSSSEVGTIQTADTLTLAICRFARALIDRKDER